MLQHRDELVAAHARDSLTQDTLEDRNLAITGYIQIKLGALAAALGAT